jgi:DNA modification methylase
MHPTLPDQCINAGITSPPYFGLRDYGIQGQLGLEKTVQEHIANQVQVFHEFRRKLHYDGTLWVVIGDSYSGKNLLGIPWTLAFALRADGWIPRQEIIWNKSNPLPESVADPCTRSHEKVFHLTKSERYYYDYKSIMEPVADPLRRNRKPRVFGVKIQWEHSAMTLATHSRIMAVGGNVRRVPINKEVKEAHFATFPSALIEPCVKAGCPEGGVCLDMFAGSGTVGAVSLHAQSPSSAHRTESEILRDH